MLRASNVLAVVLLLGAATVAAQPLNVQPQASSMAPAQAMQLNGLPPELPRAEVMSFEAAVSRALTRNPSAAVALEEVARARAVVEEVRSSSLPTL
ncbi:MAG TPA: hypothetical protein VHB97_12150, partial [Polyangia bacterium]|nr:hypothetical protein [Polyangia bacterium]